MSVVSLPPSPRPKKSGKKEGCTLTSAVTVWALHLLAPPHFERIVQAHAQTRYGRDNAGCALCRQRRCATLDIVIKTRSLEVTVFMELGCWREWRNVADSAQKGYPRSYNRDRKGLNSGLLILHRIFTVDDLLIALKNYVPASAFI